jgi:hypothetical protein
VYIYTCIHICVKGDLSESRGLFDKFYGVWKRYDFLPEAFNIQAQILMCVCGCGCVGVWVSVCGCGCGGGWGGVEEE